MESAAKDIRQDKESKREAFREVYKDLTSPEGKAEESLLLQPMSKASDLYNRASLRCLGKEAQCMVHT